MKFLKYFTYFFCLLFLLLIILGHTQIGNLSSPSNLKGTQYLKIGNNQIRYSQIGEGKDILLIHGTPGSIEDWSTIAGPLSENYRVTTFDRLGHGYSSNNDYHFNLEDNAKLVGDIIEKLNLQSPMVIGHSYGGSTIAQMLVNHYDDSLHYMIIDAPLFTYEPSLSLKLLAIPIIGKGIGFFANYTIAEKQIEDGLRTAFINQSESDLKKHIDVRKEIWLQPKVLLSKSKESVNYQDNLENISQHYSQISADVIVVTGSNDDITFLSHAKSFSQSVPTDSLVILSNTAHYIQFDQSEEIIKLITEKLNQNQK